MGDLVVAVDVRESTGKKAARENLRDGVPMMTMATAHPAKFPDAVERATGVRPPLPPHLSNLFDLPEHVTRLPNDLAAIQQFVSTTFTA